MCGDECYYERSLTEGILTGASCNEEKSRQFLKEYSAPEYRPLFFHDPKILTGRVGYAVVEEG